MNGDFPGATRPAGFWIRLCALLVDVLLFVIVQRSLIFVSGRRFSHEIGNTGRLDTVVVFYTLLFSAAYFIVLHAATGQTVGKMLFDVRVVADDGGRVTFGAALLRYLGYYVSLFTLGFGFLMAGLRRDRRALHDLVAGTRVERRVAPRSAGPAVAPVP